MKDSDFAEELKNVFRKLRSAPQVLREQNEELTARIIRFFKDHPTPTDKEIHAFANAIGMDEHKFEEVIYSILGSFFGHGRAKEKGVDFNDVDQSELAMGIEVELEHTNSREMAKRIALDHLAELPDYYTRLKKMESEGGAD